MHPYKVAYGGRYGLKTWSFARALIALGAAQRLRIVCGRQILRSIADSSHKVLCDQITDLGLDAFFDRQDQRISGRNGTEITYAGLGEMTARSIKSREAIDILWAEEAQEITDEVWATVLPTIRGESSEVWVSFNPRLNTDATWRRFVVTPPPGTVAVKTTWEYARACGYFTDKMEALRRHDQKFFPHEYENIWEGAPASAVAGAIYAREVAAAAAEGRLRATPYDPRHKVHAIWDLGWNDAMAIIMAQKPSPSAVNIINYYEDSQRTYAQCVADLNALGYVWGTDWLPHDGANKDPKGGQSASQVLQALGRHVRVIGRGDVEDGIRQVRMMMPRLYIDDGKRERATGFLGGARLIDCLRRYRRAVPKTTNEPAQPVHDEFSHGADALRGLAMIVDRIRDDSGAPAPSLAPFQNADPSMGMLG